MENKPVGLTKDTGWQIGLRKTIPVSLNRLWELITSNQGLDIWLGKGKPFKLIEGVEYQREDGTSGEVRVIKPLSHLRITRCPPDPSYSRASTIQIRVVPVDKKSTLVFHEEHLPSQEARQNRKEFYLRAVDQILELLRAEE